MQLYFNSLLKCQKKRNMPIEVPLSTKLNETIIYQINDTLVD